MSKNKEDTSTKEFLDTKVEEIKKMYNLEEVEQIGSESLTLAIGDHICGVYTGDSITINNKGDEINLIHLQTKDGMISIAKSYELIDPMKSISKGDKIVVLCYDSAVSNAGREFKKFKLFKVK